MGALLTFGVLAFGGAAGMWVLLPRLFPQLPPLVTCPEAIPAEGTTCPADETCSYPTDTSCGLRPVVATCKDAAWTVAMAPCPTPTCPDAAPEAGAACESADLRCEYTVEKTCGKLPLHALCGTAGTWELQAEACPRNTTTTTASTVACPSSAPADASACASEKQRCTYRVSTDCGFQAMTASCQNGRWSAKPPTCESKPANAPGVVSIAGDVLVELVSTSGAHVAPGRVPAGHYTVWADFGNGPTDAYVSLDVRAGESVTVKCSKMMGRCSKQ